MQHKPEGTDRLEWLFHRFYTDQISEEEKNELARLLMQEEYKSRLPELLKREWNGQGEETIFSAAQSEAIYANIFGANGTSESNVTPMQKPWWRIAAAAAVIGLVFIGYLFITKKEANRQVAKLETQPHKTFYKEPSPGKEGGILTLADGRQIVLDSAGNGLLAEQGSVQVNLQNGQISYEGDAATVMYNMMSTPRGRQYALVLADGSKVWLNAASSIRFPTAFIGAERRVEVTGEAYFEITHQPAQPFFVKANGTEVTVLGTHFNVNAYGDEPVVKTTLLQGKVSIKNGNNTATLLPGEQGQTSGTDNVRVMKNVDTDNVMAWKNGLFSLSGISVEVLMKQISRWYDVEVKFAGTVPSRKFVGSISRNVPLSDVLKALKELGINNRWEGGEVIIQP